MTDRSMAWISDDISPNLQRLPVGRDRRGHECEPVARLEDSWLQRLTDL
jgi:hypothetical protein